MPFSLRNLPAIHIDGPSALATRPVLDFNEALRREIDAAIQAMLSNQDTEFLRSLGVTCNGVIGSAHRGLMAQQVKNWGITNGRQILIDADIDDIIRQFAWARRRTPAIRLNVLQAQARQMMIAAPVDPQVGG
jgi:hypothetical protein